jgi:hypothetical protein
LEIETRRIQHYYENIKGQRKIDAPTLAISEGSKQVKDFELHELEDVEEWIFDELKEQKISTANDFLKANTDTLVDTTRIDEDSLIEIREKIETKLLEIE